MCRSPNPRVKILKKHSGGDHENAIEDGGTREPISAPGYTHVTRSQQRDLEKRLIQTETRSGVHECLMGFQYVKF